MELDVIAGLVVAYVLQWMRGFKKVPTPVTWLVAFVAGAALFWFKDADAGLNVFADKTWWQQAVVWTFAVKGGARAFADLKAAPKTDSL